jgi:uncharacterized protein
MTSTPASDDYDLALLDHHLCALELPEDAMMLSELDGYLTAIALAPTMIPPSEWLPEVWGGADPPFAGAQEAGGVFAAIMGLYNDNLGALADPGRPFEPLLEIDTDGSAFADIWAQGFVRGVKLRFEDWKPLFEDKAAFEALAPILALSTEPAEVPEISLKERSKISRSAPRLFPGYVAQIRAFWRSRGLAPSPLPRTGPSRKSAWIAGQRSAWAEAHGQRPTAKVGRNDPCPCGSGKKYKRCCGAQ